MSQLPSRSKRHLSDEHWIPLSDLMTGLMMVFMLIAVAFMIQVKAQSERVEDQKKKAEEQAGRMRQVADVYMSLRDQLAKDLDAAFQKDFERWGAELEKESLIIRFKDRDVLFPAGSAEMTQQFKLILNEFFPRYLGILASDKYRSSVEELRIEGHTSSNWDAALLPGETPYMKNMFLSQARTRSVLQAILTMPRTADVQSWLIAHTTANGLSSSKLRYNENKMEDRAASRRVEFSVRTNAEARLREVLGASRE